MSQIQIHVLPEMLPATGLAGSVAVVIDILRASTTIVHALGQGARRMIPCASIEEAHETAARLPGEQPLLGGERHGKLIPGFDLDNSPYSYSTDRVQGRTIVFTTTNGTKALRASESADRILIGAFVNFSSVVRALKADGRDVHLVCAGTDGRMTAEDILFAGKVARELVLNSTETSFTSGSLATDLAMQFAERRSRTADSFRRTMRESRGGRNLVELGYDRDIDRASQFDLFDLVPEWSQVSRDLRSPAVPSG